MVSWFHTMIDGELWNLDLWFFNQETIDKAKHYCDNIVKMTAQIPGSRECFLNAMLKLRIIYKQHVKTDTNPFIDIRLYSDPSIILFLPLSSSIPVP